MSRRSGIQPTSTPAPPSISPSGRIAFHSDPGGSDDLYLMDGDGSHLVQLTHSMETSVPPVWSPDGTRLAFVCCLPSRDSIYVVRAHGSDLRKLAQAPGEVGTPTWSPDSARLAFSDYEQDRIDVVGADGTGLHPLIDHGTDPDWSPDGSTILFISNADGDLEVFTAKADGARRRQLTHNHADDYEPRWSPDGTRLLFVSERDGNSEIYVMGADGIGQRNLSRSAVPDDFPAWSPDSRRAAYVAYEDGADPHTIGAGNAEVYLVNVDGSGRRDLLNDPAWDGDPAWSPDGHRLVYTRRTDHGELYVVDVDHPHPRPLSGVPGIANDCCAAWQP